MAYEKKTWAAGDVIEAAALNNLEAGVAAASAWNGAVEGLLARTGRADDYAYLGATPLTLEAGGDLRLSAAGPCAYLLESDTAADIEHGRIDCTGCTLDTSDGYYAFTNGQDVERWYLAHADLTLGGLTAGEAYALVVDCLGRSIDEDNGLQYGYFIVCDADGTQLSSMDPLPPARSSLEASTLAFTAPGDTVVVKIYPANGGAITAGGRCNFNSLWINRAGAGRARTGIYRRAGSFSGALTLADVPAGVRVSADPACGVSLRGRERTLARLLGRHAGRTIVCFGDSVTGNADAPDDYPTALAEELGATVINAGFGGCRMSATHPEPAYDAFSMARLADAVASGDWSLQAQYAAQLPALTHAEAHLSALRALDWSRVDIVTIAYGTNDIQGGVPIDDPAAPTSAATCTGALRGAVEALLTAWPQLRILVCTPIYRYWNDLDADSDERTFADGHAFTDWGDAMIAAAAGYGLPSLDLYRTAGFNRLTRGRFFPETDGTHPNAVGQRRIGEKLAARLLAEY